MIPGERLEQLLSADESDILERKASFSEADKIRDTMIAFANDLAERGGGTIIIGQNPNKTIKGLEIGADAAQQKITEIARNRCFPAIGVVIDTTEIGGKRIAIVEVKSSSARPHFRGAC